MRVVPQPVAMALVCVPLGACFAVTDLDRFAGCEDAPLDAPTALRLQLRGAGSVLDEGFLDVLVTRMDQSATFARAILEDLDGSSGEDDLVKIFMPGAIPAGQAVSVFTFADRDHDHDYDRTGEPSIAARLCAHGRFALTLSSESDSAFDGTDVGSAYLELWGFGGGEGAHFGDRMEFRIVKVSDGRVVAYYRTHLLDESDDPLVIDIPGVIEPNSAYRVDFFADVRANHIFDLSEGDHAWSRPAAGDPPLESDDAGRLEFSFDHQTPFDALDFAPPDF